MDATVRVQAYRIAEHKDVRLPIMICQDGFITSHAVENIELLEDDIVKTFVGEYEPEHYLLKDNEPFAVGPYAVTNYVMEAKRAQMQGLRNAKQVTLDVAKEFEQISGRSYGLFEEYRMEDADYAMVIIGSAAGTGKDTVDMLRKQGVRAGLLKIRLFRPFPAEEIAEALKNVNTSRSWIVRKITMVTVALLVQKQICSLQRRPSPSYIKLLLWYRWS